MTTFSADPPVSLGDPRGHISASLKFSAPPGPGRGYNQPAKEQREQGEKKGRGRKKEEGRRKKEEGRRKKEEGRRKKDFNRDPAVPSSN